MMRFVAAAAAAIALFISPAAAQQRTSNASPSAQADASADATTHAAHDKDQHCAAMQKKMGTAPVHDHSEMKGTVAISSMNRQHMDCQQMKKKAAPAR